MTEKQRVFCEEYAKRYQAIPSYLAAFPDASYSTAHSQAYKLLRKPELMEYIKKLQAQAVSDYGNVSELIAKELLEDITYRDDDGNHSAGWQKSVDLLSKNLGLQKQDISVKQTTITVDIDE